MVKILNKLHSRFLVENVAYGCKMFWCIPKITDSNNIEWDSVSFDSDNDDLSNWVIVLYMLKNNWGTDFESCKNSYYGLPRGILVDNVLYHGNNIPKPMDLSCIITKLGYKPNEITPCFNDKYTINKDDLGRIESVIGRSLDLEYTD